MTLLAALDPFSSSFSEAWIDPFSEAPSFLPHKGIGLTPSFLPILYREAMELSEYAIQDATQRRYCSPIGSVTPELLARILRGGLNSKFLKNRLKKIISDHLDQR